MVKYKELLRRACTLSESSIFGSNIQSDAKKRQIEFWTKLELNNVPESTARYDEYSLLVLRLVN